MKKDKVAKLIATGVMGISVLSMPFMVTGCDKDDTVNVQVKDGYIQWREEDDSSWHNLISIDEVKNILGDGFKGDTGSKGDKGDPGIQGNPGAPGVDGKNVEFRFANDCIQWRYVGADQGDDENWVNLVSIDDLIASEDNDQVIAEVKERAFNLFQSKLGALNGDYKVTYEYEDEVVVESYNSSRGFTINEDGWNGNILYTYSSVIYSDINDEYHLNILPVLQSGWKATKSIVHTYSYEAKEKNYEYKHSGGQTLGYVSVPENFNFNYVENLKKFSLNNVISCDFNESGDCVVLFQDHGVATLYPYMNADYIYEFNVNRHGYIEKCYVYEKGFLRNTDKGELVCKITYEKNATLITSDLFTEVLAKEKEANDSIQNWFDAFGIVKE